MKNMEKILVSSSSRYNGGKYIAIISAEDRVKLSFHKNKTRRHRAPLSSDNNYFSVY